MRSLTGTMLVLLIAATAAPARADVYAVDAVHSSVVFRVKHMGVSYCYGRFNKVAGTFDLNADDPAAGTIDVTVETASVDTANDKRDEHLRNADFFDAAEFPAIRFEATKISRTGEEPYTVEGKLTLHGVTRPVTIQVEPTGTAKGQFGEMRSGCEAIFTVRRSEFGMDRNIGPVADDVRLMISLEGIRQ